jgi:hypothetical protein
MRTPVIRTANYPDRLGPWVKFVENSKKLTCLEITGYCIKYSTVLWLLELQIRRGREVLTQVHTLNIESRTSNSPCRLFSKKNSVIRIFCISGWFAVQINPDKWSATVFNFRLTSVTVRESTACIVSSNAAFVLRTNQRVKIGAHLHVVYWKNLFRKRAWETEFSRIRKQAQTRISGGFSQLPLPGNNSKWHLTHLMSDIYIAFLKRKNNVACSWALLKNNSRTIEICHLEDHV